MSIPQITEKSREWSALRATAHLRLAIGCIEKLEELTGKRIEWQVGNEESNCWATADDLRGLIEAIQELTDLCGLLDAIQDVEE